jgi:hypothetical protein
VLQPQLGSPVTECGPGIGAEEPHEGAFAGPAVPAPLAKRTAIGRVIREYGLYYGESRIVQRRKLQPSRGEALEL